MFQVSFWNGCRGVRDRYSAKLPKVSAGFEAITIFFELFNSRNTTAFFLEGLPVVFEPFLWFLVMAYLDRLDI